MGDTNIYESICQQTGLAYAYVFDTLNSLPRANGYMYCSQVQKIYEMSLFNRELAGSLKHLFSVNKKLLNMLEIHEYNGEKLMPGMIIEQAEKLLNGKQHDIYVIVKNGDCYALCRYMLNRTLSKECIAIGRTHDEVTDRYTNIISIARNSIYESRKNDFLKLGLSEQDLSSLQRQKNRTKHTL